MERIIYNQHFYKLNALVLDIEVFVRPRAWISINRVGRWKGTTGSSFTICCDLGHSISFTVGITGSWMWTCIHVCSSEIGIDNFDSPSKWTANSWCWTFTYRCKSKIWFWNPLGGKVLIIFGF